jgi:hypothetical protein
LKGDLLPLATLLKVDVDDSMKVEQIKQALKPVAELLKGPPTAAKSKAAADSAGPRRGARPKALQHGPRSSSAEPEPALPVPGPINAMPSTSSQGLTQQDIEELFLRQDQRVQTMLSQAMQQMMATMQPLHSQDVAAAYVQASPQNYQLTDAEMEEINAMHQAELQDERLWNEHGEELAWMTMQEMEDLQKQDLER